MRPISILLCGLLLTVGVSAEVKAAQAEFWVVGSFESLPGAITEQRRIEGRSGLSVRIGTFNRATQPAYRLLIEKNDRPDRQRQKIRDAGITPWTLKTSASSLDWSADDVSEHDWAQYLVLAGFRDEARAGQFVQRLKSEGLSDLGLDEIEMDGTPYFRVLYGPFDMKDKEVLEEVKELGLTDSWWVIKDGGERPRQSKSFASRPDEKPRESKTAPSMSDEKPRESTTTASMSDETPMDSSPRESQSAMRVSPPGPGESLLDYCMKRANSAERERFCQDGGSMSVAVKAEQARRGHLSDEEYFRFCTSEATADQRKEHCSDAELLKKLRRLGETR